MSRSNVIHYPQQDGAYAVKVKNGAGWRGFDIARFHISVGQMYHEGEKFKATLQWAKHRFDKVIICVNDTLQHHNHEFDGMSEQAAFLRAENNGAEWITRNQAVIDELPNVELFRWEQWRNLPEFNIEHEKIKALYRDDHSIKQAIDNDVRTFWTRRQKIQGLSDHYRFMKFQEHAVRYLIEESAVFSLMFRRDEAVDIYPGSTLLPCVLFKNETGLGEKSFTRIDFARTKRVQRPEMSRIAYM